MDIESGTISTGHPYAVIGAGKETIYVFGGIEPKHTVPEGLHLQGLARAFAPLAQDYRVVVIKRPAGMPRGFSQAQMSDQYEVAVRELGSGTRGVVLGIAAGGTIAQYFAAEHGDLVSRLVLISTANRMSEPGRQVLSRAVALAEAGNIRRANQLMIERLYPSRVASAFYGALGWLFPGFSAGDDPREFVVEAEAAAAADTFRCAADISVPALLMSGDRDFFYDAGDVSATAAAIPDGEVVLFRRQGHGLPRTRAEEVFQHTLAYLKEHRA